MTCLRVLAKLKTAQTSEIASLAGFSTRTARNALNALAKRNYVTHIDPTTVVDKSKPLYSKKYQFWEIRRNGVIEALRSWDVSPGVPFASRVEKEHWMGEGNRHRSVARMWPANLKVCFGKSESIWAGWTEVTLEGLRFTPDALAWGKKDEREVLFWLEVETGHISSEALALRYGHRLARASRYAKERDINLVFAVLSGKEWIANVLEMAFMDIEPHVATILGGWKFGTLPAARWGGVVKAPAEAYEVNRTE